MVGGGGGAAPVREDAAGWADLASAKNSRGGHGDDEEDEEMRDITVPDDHVEKTVQVPDVLVFHLKKNSRKKLTNIEVNTKTMLHVVGMAKNGTCVLRISGDSDKRISAAMVIVEKLRRSIKTNPDHFSKDGAKLAGRALHDYREDLRVKTKKAKKEGAAAKLNPPPAPVTAPRGRGNGTGKGDGRGRDGAPSGDGSKGHKEGGGGKSDKTDKADKPAFVPRGRNKDKNQGSKGGARHTPKEGTNGKLTPRVVKASGSGSGPSKHSI